MSKYNIEADPSDNNLFYFNGTQFNASDTIAVPAEIDSTLQSPLIENSSDYEVSVMRLLVSGNALPIFFVDTLTDSPPYITKYVVTISYNGFTESEPITYVPLNNVNVNAFNGDQIFNVYTYQEWLDYVNTAYLACYDRLIIAGSGIELVASSPPIFTYDAADNFISYYVESSYESSLPNPINIYMNKLLFDFFTSFEAFYAADPYFNGDVQGVKLITSATNAFLLSSVGNIPPAAGAIVPIAPYAVWKVQQEYVSVYSWNSIRSLLLTSNIGTIPESIPNLGEPNNYDATRSSLQILTDFDLDFSPDIRSGARGYIQYVPRSEYRWSSLTRGSALNRINVKVQFVTFTNVVRNFYINPNFFFTIKLLFKKKVQTIKL